MSVLKSARTSSRFTDPRKINERATKGIIERVPCCGMFSTRTALVSRLNLKIGPKRDGVWVMISIFKKELVVVEQQESATEERSQSLE
jgi:hypothetical protein